MIEARGFSKFRVVSRKISGSWIDVLARREGAGGREIEASWIDVESLSWVTVKSAWSMVRGFKCDMPGVGPCKHSSETKTSL